MAGDECETKSGYASPSLSPLESSAIRPRAGNVWLTSPLYTVGRGTATSELFATGHQEPAGKYSLLERIAMKCSAATAPEPGWHVN